MARGVVQLQQLVVVVGGVALNARMLLPRRLFSIRIFRYSDIPLVDHKRIPQGYQTTNDSHTN
uniref:Uncharacterized protein n=2 Tax=Oryza TaxID=4527 RepID=A0A0E0NTM2_ORYRU